MHLRQWTTLINLPTLLQLACVNAAFSDDDDPHPYDSAILIQDESFVRLCPDYTTYARHIQYVRSIPPWLLNTDLTAQRTSKQRTVTTTISTTASQLPQVLISSRGKGA